MTGKLYVLNGPNLNLLGKRQPEIYGTDTLEDAASLVREVASPAGVDVDFRQTNHEGELVDWIHVARLKAAAIIINPAAYTHTSIAVMDALFTFEGPVIEVHLSNVHKREAFRHHSFVSARADAVIAGCGIQGYALATQRVLALLQNN